MSGGFVVDFGSDDIGSGDTGEDPICRVCAVAIIDNNGRNRMVRFVEEFVLDNGYVEIISAVSKWRAGCFVNSIVFERNGVKVGIGSDSTCNDLGGSRGASNMTTSAIIGGQDRNVVEAREFGCVSDTISAVTVVGHNKCGG